MTVRLIPAVVCFILILAPCAVSAASQQAAPAPAPAVFLVYGNGTNTFNPPPVLIIDAPVISFLNCTVNGLAESGTTNATISAIRWDWGDAAAPEYHGFPNSHTYSRPGNFALVVTVQQSDGQYVIETMNISLGQQTIPGTSSGSQNPPLQNTSGVSGLSAGGPALPSLGSVIDRVNGVMADLNQKIPGPSAPVAAGPPSDSLFVPSVILAAGIILIVIGVWILRVAQKKNIAPSSPVSLTGPSAPERRGSLPSAEDLGAICAGTDVSPAVLGSVIRVGMEIARDGREGQAIGTSFIVGDAGNVLNYSRQFVLNPFYGHGEADRQVTDTRIWGNIKEFAQLDGAFIITGTGVIEAAGRCITADMSRVDLPGGLGSRHTSVAGVTQVTRSIGVVVSQSGGQISVFRDGSIVLSIHS